MTKRSKIFKKLRACVFLADKYDPVKILEAKVMNYENHRYLIIYLLFFQNFDLTRKIRTKDNREKMHSIQRYSFEKNIKVKIKNRINF